MESSAIRVGDQSLSSATRTSVQMLHPVHSMMLSFQDCSLSSSSSCTLNGSLKNYLGDVSQMTRVILHGSYMNLYLISVAGICCVFPYNMCRIVIKLLFSNAWIPCCISAVRSNFGIHIKEWIIQVYPSYVSATKKTGSRGSIRLVRSLFNRPGDATCSSIQYRIRAE